MRGLLHNCRNLVLLALAVSACFQINAVAAVDKNALLTALNAHTRDVAHLLRDAARKPVAVMEFLEIDTGMRVLDVYAADGYFTFILSQVVGADGTVFAQNPAPGSNVEDIRQMYSLADALDQRIEIAELSNVIHLRENFFDLSIEPESLDVILLAQILHDFSNSDPSYAANLLSHLQTLLKPGGTLAIIDHAGDAGQDNSRLHRMLQSQAEELAAHAGFKLQAASAILANAADRRRRPVFDPMLGRNTDQFLLRFTKSIPAESPN